ncbi:MAG: DUF58 domain-containing protein [Thermoleophilia bacterium]
MRALPAGPSGRAVALAGAGVVALVASRGFGTTALATLGVGLIALPVLATLLVWAVARGLRVRRRVSPARCRAGDTVTVALTLGGWPARSGLAHVLGIALDPGLGSLRGPEAPRMETSRSWRVTSAPRGDHLLPPPRLRVTDPFGLAGAARAGRGDTRLLVAPRAPAVPGLELVARFDGSGPRRRRAVSGFGELDRVRDYQAGDPLSRIHWPQTAKRGRLQTKELKAAEGFGRSVLIVLDGAAAGGRDFETAVTAAAAIARHLAERAEPVGLVHTGRRPARLAVGRAAWPELELALTQLEPGGERALALAVRAEATAADAPDLMIVCTSAVDAGLGPALAQAHGAGVATAVILAGAAAAAAPELARGGTDIAIVAGQDDVARALSPREARVVVS